MIKRGPHIITDQLTFYVDAANSKSYTSGSSETLNIINPSINPGSLDNGINFTSEDRGKWIFDGSDDEITFDKLSNGNWGTDSWSVNLWFSTTSSISNSPMLGLCGKWSGNNYQEGWSIALRGATYNGILVRLISGSANHLSGTGGIRDIQPSENITSSLSDGKGHNITVTFDSLTRVGSLYVDGESVGSSPGYNAGFTWENYITESNLYIGKGSNLGSYFPGEISNVSFYRKSLSPKEIKQNYNALKGRFG